MIPMTMIIYAPFSRLDIKRLFFVHFNKYSFSAWTAVWWRTTSSNLPSTNSAWTFWRDPWKRPIAAATKRRCTKPKSLSFLIDEQLYCLMHTSHFLKYICPRFVWHGDQHDTKESFFKGSGQVLLHWFHWLTAPCWYTRGTAEHRKTNAWLALPSFFIFKCYNLHTTSYWSLIKNGIIQHEHNFTWGATKCWSPKGKKTNFI